MAFDHHKQFTQCDFTALGNAIASGQVHTARHEYHCYGCKVVTALNRLDDNMLCEACGGVEAEDVIDTSPAAMLRAHSTWSV